jgi:hypothetical protein
MKYGKDIVIRGKGKKPTASDFIKDRKVLEIIQKRLSIREEEKKLYGEVFTPIELICQGFDYLPKDVWTNPNLKWLDPVNGIGNFTVVAYYKLYDSLKSKIPDASERSKHIIENMLYMVELNPVNVRVCIKIFKMIDDKAKPNIIRHDFLKFQGFKGIDKFDIIMGNPPFSKKVGPSKNQPIWGLFVKDSIIKYLEKDGYLIFIHPSGWRNISGRFRYVYDLIQERDLMNLTMRDYRDGIKAFGVATNYDYYCLKNTITKKNITKINDIDKNNIEIDLNDYEFIPGGMFKEFEKLKGQNKVEIIYATNTYETRPDKSKNPIKKIEDKIFKFPIINTITKKAGAKLIYSSVKDKKIFVPKVVWSNGVGTYPIVDDTGKYGLTQFSYGIKDEPKNLKYIQKALNNPQFIKLMNYVKFTDNKYNYKIIGSFKKDFYKQYLSDEPKTPSTTYSPNDPVKSSKTSTD